MESGMKLRKARKAPKRFDDYAWEQEEEDRELSATITLPKARACSAIHTQPHTLPFNPNLPPAAFPTLEYSTSRKEASMAAGSPHAKSLVLNTKIQSHIEWLRNNKIKAERAESAKIPIPPPYTAPPDIQSDSMYDDLCRIKAQRETAEIIYHQNLAGSDIYARNMEILDRMARRTSDDWNIQEMTTSDEEESSPVISGQLKKSPPTSTSTSTSTPTTTASAAPWDKLSAAHQIDLVLTLYAIYGSITAAMQKLCLNTVQSQNMLHFMERYPESEIDEAKHITEMKADKIPIMLSSDSDEDNRRHLRWVNVEKLTLSTSKELAKAKAYLGSCGKKPALLDHWKSLLYDHGSSCDKNCPKLISSLLLPAEAEKVRSRLTPQPEKPNCEHTFRLCAEAPSQKPLYKTPHSPITFLYPLSPDCSPPPRKFAKVGGKKIAQKSHPAAQRHSATPTSQRTLASRRPNLSVSGSNLELVSPNLSPATSNFSSATSSLSPATSNFSPATSNFSSTSSSSEPSSTKNSRLGGRTGGKHKPVTGVWKKRVVSGFSSKRVDPMRRLLG